MSKTENARTFLFAFAGATLACVLVLGGFCVWLSMNDETTSLGFDSDTIVSYETIELGAATQTTIVAEDESVTLAEAVAEKVLPSVASIDVYTISSSTSDQDGEVDLQFLEQYSWGSGVILTEDGYILTNYHVLDNYDVIKVTIEGVKYDVEIVGVDISSDLAVLKVIGGSGFTPIEIGDSDDLSVGEWVMTVGSPLGYEQSVSTGVISAIGRTHISSDAESNSDETMVYPYLIQTDAVINPGNSGGALVNKDGDLVGINALISSYSGSYAGVGFAISANYALSIAEQIIAGETPVHAELGASVLSVTSSMVSLYGVTTSSGAYIESVESGSSAEMAGLQIGDIIIGFDGVAIESAGDLVIAVRSNNPGDQVVLEVNRSGQVFEVVVVLGSDEETEDEGEDDEEGLSSAAESFIEWLWDSLL